uniref:Uncharacterized protein n=1 Tax=Heterorhabditis bacteriophora TaxID=37862 RepID=A0A1I7WGW8_HETBA
MHQKNISFIVSIRLISFKTTNQCFKYGSNFPYYYENCIYEEDDYYGSPKIPVDIPAANVIFQCSRRVIKNPAFLQMCATDVSLVVCVVPRLKLEDALHDERDIFVPTTGFTIVQCRIWVEIDRIIGAFLIL